VRQRVCGISSAHRKLAIRSRDALEGGE